MQRCYFGFDVGTSSSKGVLVREDGRLLRSATREHAVHRPAVGHVEADPELWWRELQDVAAELTGPGDVDVVSVGVSGMGPCVVLTDEAGAVLRPAILYGVDTRARCRSSELDAELGRDAVLQRCGSVLSSQAVGPKIAVARPARAGGLEPGAPAAHARLVPRPAAHRCLRAGPPLGQPVHPHVRPVDRGVDARGRRSVAGHLPAAGAPLGGGGGRSHPRGGGRHLPAGVPVIAGTIDAWSEALSVGAHRVGDLMLMYGTTMFLVATVPEPVTSEAMWGTAASCPEPAASQAVWRPQVR